MTKDVTSGHDFLNELAQETALIKVGIRCAGCHEEPIRLRNSARVEGWLRNMPSI